MDENILNMDKIPDGLTSEKELIWLYHIFVDAAHDQKSVRMDLYAWYPKLKDNAVFCGHDFRPQMGVQLALKEFMKEHPYTLSRMKGGSIWQLHHK
jgi:hypothetical protein